MNIIQVKIDFEKGLCQKEGISVVTGDYNSTKIEFEFNESAADGRKIFELKNSDDELVYVDEIVNNEVILVGKREEEGEEKLFSLFNKEGDYTFEVSLYGENSKLTSVYDYITARKEQVIVDDETVEQYMPLFDNLMQELSNKVEEADSKIDEIDQAIEDVNQAVQDAEEAVESTNNLNIDVNKVDKTTQVDLTKKDGTIKTVYINDGTSLQFMWQGTSLGIKTDDMEQYVFVDLQGIQGQPGPQGEPFRIKKEYASVAEMNADFDNMNVGDYVMIASTVEIEDNAKLYVKGDSQWIFITDFSGAQGIKGETGATPIIRIGTVVSGSTPSVTISGTAEEPVFNFVLQPGEKGEKGDTGLKGDTGNGIASIAKTSSAGLIDTYTITFTDGTTSTFNITNGQDGEVTQEYVDEHDDQLRTLFNVLPKVSDSGESVTLENTGDTMLYKMDLKGNTSQEVIQGEVGTEVEDTSIYVSDVNEDKENYITLKGNTYQDSTSGYNKLATITNLNYIKTKNTSGNWNNNSYSISGITFTFNSNGTITINGTSTQNASLSLLGTYLITDQEIINGNYIILGYTSSDIAMRVLNYSETYTYLGTNQSSTTPTQLDLSTFTTGYVEIVVSSGKTINNVTIKPMLTNTSQTDYEPFTNGASPNPDYPQEIEVVTGNNTIKVEGKNLFDKDNANVLNGYINASGRLNLYNYETADKIIYIDCKPNTTYSLQKMLQGTTSKNRFRVGTLDKIPENQDVIEQFYNAGDGSTVQTYTITTNSTANYLIFYCYSGDNETSFEQMLNSIQLEKGTTATTYEAYQGASYQVNLGRYVPAGYTQVDYIESSGTQYIDTGYTPVQNDEFEIKNITSIVGNNTSVIISAGSGTYQLIIVSQPRDTYYKYFAAGNAARFSQIGYNNNTIVINKDGKIYVDGKLKATSSYGGDVNSSLNIFRRANGTSYFVGRIGELIITNNNVKKRHFIPCYRNSDNEVGLYDLVNNVFYTNQGTGAFTYGNVVPNTSIELCKIGTYQDRIYKSLVDGNWYVHKEIGKVVLDGTGYWANTSEGDTTNGFSIFGTSINNIISDTSKILYCDMFKYISRNSLTSSSINFVSSGSDNIVILNIDRDLLAEKTTTGFKNWLGTNQPLLYYPLQTPTDTQITDTTLVNQLNALYNATIYSTTHINTETSNLLPYIDLKYNVVTASPSPERASEVEVVKGNNTITISNEDGTKTQTYNITLGNLELCKIGDYQDYFYKDNGNWYKYGAIGKVVLNGSEDDWTLSPSGNLNRYLHQLTNPVTSTTCMSDYFTSIPYLNAQDYGCYIGASGKVALFYNAITSVNDFENWLSNNNTIIYYPLSTPTTTQITDQLLVSQLNELKKAMSYYDKTLITQTNADKPFILDVIAIRDLQDIFNI